jgi:hypothetical protein
MGLNDLYGHVEEGLSVNGSEGLGGHAQGFDIQNQGVTRRAPGEGPKVNGGRSQSQAMDSYDQPQYGVEEGAVEDARGAVRKMKYAVGKMDHTFKKSIGKEKAEHPWMTQKQATQVARDHEKEKNPRMGEVFKIK